MQELIFLLLLLILFWRVPLYGEDPNEILKVLFVRDLLEAVAAGSTDMPILEIGRMPIFVPENQNVDQLLSLLRKNKRHRDSHTLDQLTGRPFNGSRACIRRPIRVPGENRNADRRFPGRSGTPPS